MKIRSVNNSDMEAIAAIYNDYIATSTISFEEEPVTGADMRQRVEKVFQAELPWLVAEIDGQVQGYAYAGQWHTRSAYRFTVETSVYLAKSARGKGAGMALYEQLLQDLKTLNVKNILGVIALPNEASIALHEKLGFRKVGEFTDVGFKFDRWISVGYWQLQFEVAA